MTKRNRTKDLWEEVVEKLLSELKPKEVIVPIRGLIAGYTWNSKKKELRFLTLKETEELTKKGIAWRSLSEEWNKND